MIEMKIESKKCKMKVEGTKLDCMADIEFGFLELAKSMSKITGKSIELSALHIYQTAMRAYVKFNEVKDEVSD